MCPMVLTNYLVDADHALFEGLQTKGKNVSLLSIERQIFNLNVNLATSEF